MTDAAAHHEQVPDSVVEGNKAVGQVENHPGGVGDAAGQDQPEAHLVQFSGQFPGGEQDQPAHGQVNAHPHQFETVPVHGLQTDADQRQCPDHRKQDPAGLAAQIHQQEGRVGAGDQPIDGAVIEHLEHRPPFRVTQAVVQGAGAVEQNQAGTENTETDHFPGVALQAGGNNQYHRAGDTQGGADAVRQAVQPFFQNRVIRFRLRGCGH